MGMNIYSPETEEIKVKQTGCCLILKGKMICDYSLLSKGNLTMDIIAPGFQVLVVDSKDQESEECVLFNTP